MWLSAPGLTQPMCSCTASRIGSSRCRRERASCPPPRSEWPWRSESRAPPSQPPAGGPSTSSTAARSAMVGAASSRWMSISLPEWSPARRRARVACCSGAISLSTRIAQALNSAVPLLGSVTSIVSRFVSTWSGKWNVMNARPGRSDRSMCTGVSTEPRREDTRTTSPSSSSMRSASSGERSSDSPRCSGER